MTRTKLFALSTAAVMAAAPLSAEIINGELLSADETITTNAAKIQNLTTLVEALETAGLADDLMGEGPYTVFAPTNSAFDENPDAVAELLKPENREQLEKVLKSHVVQGDFSMERITELFDQNDGDDEHVAEGYQIIQLDEGEEELELMTLSGDTITIQDGVGEQLVLRDGMKNIHETITQGIETANGTVYVVDGVFMPAS